MSLGRLDAVLADVARRADERRRRRSVADLRRELAPDPARRARFVARLEAGAASGLGLIAECKRRSPSAGALVDGALVEGADAFERALLYARGGADALSVLTERDHFGGALEDLAVAREAGLPVLRKDFVLDEGMVLESLEAGADALLLVARCLDGARLVELRALAGELGLAVLVEVHEERELERALAVAPELLGVNARDLTDFTLDLARVERLLPLIPEGPLRVAESGLRELDDLRRVRSAGAQVALVGERLMRAEDPAALLASWKAALVLERKPSYAPAVRPTAHEEPRAGRTRTASEPVTAFRAPRVKVCGLTREEDVRVALEAGAGALGFVLHASSPRAVTIERAAELAALVPADVLAVGVLVDATPAGALAMARAAGWDALQLCGAEGARDWRGFALPLLRRVGVGAGAERELERWRGVASAFVLDHPAAAGGSGRAVDAAIAARLAALAPCLLAGGLDASNVRVRVLAVRPAGVDASSRLESAPGRKDARALRDFVRAARAAFDGGES